MKQWKKIGWHVIFWIALIITSATSEWGYRDGLAEAIIFELLYLPVRVFAVYINWFFLIPRFLYQNKIAPYSILLTLTLAAGAIAQRYLTLYWGYPTFFPDWMNGPPQPLVFFRIVQNMIIIALPVAFATGFKLFSDWYAQRNKAQSLEKEKIQTELKYLRSQVNPHFLFNTLNNIYGLAREKSDKVPGLILKLSDILSFTLYESSAPFIPIQKELQLIRNLIDLEKDRYGERVQVQMKVADTVPDFPIAPMILMPLVENAFKHGVREEVGEALIRITVNFEGDFFIFKIENTVTSLSEEAVSTGGLGLLNLQKRLDLIYQDQYQLKFYQEDQIYIAQLKLLL